MKNLSALAIAAIAAFALIGQFYLNGYEPGEENWAYRLWLLVRFFTILTNGLIVVVMLREAMGRSMGRDWLALATMNIVLVGIIFQLLLRPEEPYTGLNFWTDLILHAIVPIAVPLWWLAFAPKPLDLSRLYIWLSWPFGYTVYAMTRGLITGEYPYFFFDVGRFGAGTVAINIVGLLAVFSLAGVVLWAVSKAMARQ